MAAIANSMRCPTRGIAMLFAGIQIDQGHHGDTRLDGLRIAAIFKWPGPIHEGNGEAVAFVDKRADDAQRSALLRIMTGQDTDPFATYVRGLCLDRDQHA
jgi:hypothetical protein